LASTINASNSGFGGIVSTGDSSGQLQLQTANTTAVTIDTSQNVGIGTTSPSNRLSVHASNPTNGQVARLRNDTASGNGTFLAFDLNSVGAAAIGIPNNTNALAFYVNNDTTERMRIDSSGNVLVGTTTASLYNQNTSNGIGLIPGTSSNLQISNDPAGSTGNACIILNFRNTPVNGAKYIRFFYNGASDIGNISLNGTTAVAYNTSSDYRLKENIAPMVGALDKLAQLKPVTYTWKADNSAGQGFIAHELQEVVPDCVSGEKDAVDDEGKPVYQGVDTSFLVATLTAAIQEQQTIINDLKARIETLEAK